MKKDKSIVPTSKAKTSYGLLRDVIKVIREEPRRLNYGEWKVRRGTAKWDFVDKHNGEPACGTIACIAGWMATLKSSDPYADVKEVALNMLPESIQDEAKRLFNPFAYYIAGGKYPYPDVREVGSMKYAEEVIKNIETFIADNLKALKKHRI